MVYLDRLITKVPKEALSLLLPPTIFNIPQSLGLSLVGHYSLSPNPIKLEQITSLLYPNLELFSPTLDPNMLCTYMPFRKENVLQKKAVSFLTSSLLRV